MVRTNRGGSVLSFVIIGVIMVALLIGGAYYVRQQTALLPMQPTAPTPQDQEEKPPEKPAEEAPRGAAPEEKREQPSKEQEPSAPPVASDATDDAKLPQSGPAEFVAVLLALGLLSATAVSYVRSRRPELSL